MPGYVTFVVLVPLESTPIRPHGNLVHTIVYTQ